MKKSILIVLCIFFSLVITYSQTGSAANLCCDESMYGIHHEITIQDLTFNIYFINTHNDLDQSHDELLVKIDSTLSRLPQAHLEIIETKRIVVGLPCKGGGARPCVQDLGNACILLSYESFRSNSNGSNAYECSKNPDGPPRSYNDAGSWVENPKSHLTLLHMVGHFVDYHYGISQGLDLEERADCSSCLSNSDCYFFGAKTHGSSEIIAQAYCEYFRRKTARAVVLGGTDDDPRSGAHPSINTRPNALFNNDRLAYLISSTAWDNWN